MFCIDEIFRNDGIANCPPPFSSDEPQSNPPKLESRNDNSDNSNQFHQTSYTQTKTTVTRTSGASDLHCQRYMFVALVISIVLNRRFSQ